MVNHKLNVPLDVAQYIFWNKLSDLPFVQSVYLFGSRARGDARPKSDIDIVRYDTLNDSLFKRKIDESKVVIYES